MRSLNWGVLADFPVERGFARDGFLIRKIGIIGFADIIGNGAGT